MSLCACGNEARYITADGRFTCALCPLREGVKSIRLADVPAFVEKHRDLSGKIEAVRHAVEWVNHGGGLGFEVHHQLDGIIEALKALE